MSNVSDAFVRHASNDFVRHMSYKSAQYSVRRWHLSDGFERHVSYSILGTFVWHISYEVVWHVSYEVVRHIWHMSYVFDITRVIRLRKTRVKYDTMSDFPLLSLGTNVLGNVNLLPINGSCMKILLLLFLMTIRCNYHLVLWMIVVLYICLTPPPKISPNFQQNRIFHIHPIQRKIPASKTQTIKWQLPVFKGLVL